MGNHRNPVVVVNLTVVLHRGMSLRKINYIKVDTKGSKWKSEFLYH